jgi:rod shape-determining protein MreD
MSRAALYGRFAVTLLTALWLQSIELPPLIAPWRPMWVPLLLAYWTLAASGLPTVFLGFILGLMFDVMLTAPLGEHALAFVALSYLLVRLRGALIVLPLWQISLVLAPLWSLLAFLLFWLDGLSHHPADPLLRWLPVVSTTLIWPLLVMLLTASNPRRRRRPKLRG